MRIDALVVAVLISSHNGGTCVPPGYGVLIEKDHREHLPFDALHDPDRSKAMNDSKPLERSEKNPKLANVVSN